MSVPTIWAGSFAASFMVCTWGRNCWRCKDAEDTPDMANRSSLTSNKNSNKKSQGRGLWLKRWRIRVDVLVRSWLSWVLGIFFIFYFLLTLTFLSCSSSLITVRMERSVDSLWLLELEFPIALLFVFKAILGKSFLSSPDAHLVLFSISFIILGNFEIDVFKDCYLDETICGCLCPLLLPVF